MLPNPVCDFCAQHDLPLLLEVLVCVLACMHAFVHTCLSALPPVAIGAAHVGRCRLAFSFCFCGPHAIDGAVLPSTTALPDSLSTSKPCSHVCTYSTHTLKILWL